MFIIILIFVLGTICGSFAICYGWRFAHHYSILHPASFCENCHIPLKKYYLIPLIGFFIQKGHCTSCHASISTVSLVSEFLMGSYFTLLFLLNNTSPLHLVFTFGLVLWALILSAQDFYSLTVSHNFLLVGGSLLSVGKFANIHFYLADWSFSLLFIIILFLFSHFNLLGSGDVIYLTFLFLLLGFYTTLCIILIGSTSAALYHFIYAQNKIPFIPFLSFGLLVLLL